MRRDASILAALFVAGAVTWASSTLTSQALHEGKTVLPGHKDSVSVVVFAPDGRTLVSAGRDRVVRAWDVSVAETAYELPAVREHAEAVYAAAFAPDGASYATGGLDKTVVIWDAGSRRARGRFANRLASIFALAYSPDSSQIAAAGDDGAVRVLDARTTKAVYVLTHPSALRAVAFSKDGLIAAGGVDGSLAVWAPRRSIKAPAVRIPQAHEGGVLAAVFSPDGTVLATSGADRAIRIWSMPEARLLNVFRGHVGAPDSLAFFSDGQTLVSAAPDKARFWDVETGIEKSLTTVPDDGPRSVAVSPDGTTLASGHADGAVRLFLLRGADERRALSAPPPPKRKPSRSI